MENLCPQTPPLNFHNLPQLPTPLCLPQPLQPPEFTLQGSYTYNLSKIHDFFHDLLKYSMT